jgi:cellobiose epimerase
MTGEIVLTPSTQHLLHNYRHEVEEELRSVLDWWMENMIDLEHGGFCATVSNNNIPGIADKGVVLNSRILWAFSAAYNFYRKEEYFQMAQRAFDYLKKYFIDEHLGGVYWSVDVDGKVSDGRKQIYGLAFCIYGLSEYYKASANDEALVLAKSLFLHIEEYSWDKKNSGYIEAFTREWNAISDLRLSEKDANERKTMNTHLHIIEAYANLYTVWPDDFLRDRIEMLLVLFSRHIINNNTHHLNLFMDDEWNVRSSLVSFGHDIEAAWLLLECAEAIRHPDHIDHYKKIAVQLAIATIEGIDTNDGGLWYEYEPAKVQWIKQKHWWPQAEAMVGFFNAYQLTADEKFLQHSVNCFGFVRQYLKDKTNGEWFWGIEAGGNVMEKEKAGFWKCPYHNSRACIELIKRISNL